MPDLFDRLINPAVTGDKMPVHTFRAAIGDYVAGQTTRNQIVAFWNLDTSAQSDLDALLVAVDAIGSNARKALWLLQLHDVLLIAEAGAKYTTKSAFAARMGL